MINPYDVLIFMGGALFINSGILSKSCSGGDVRFIGIWNKTLKPDSMWRKIFRGKCFESATYDAVIPFVISVILFLGTLAVYIVYWCNAMLVEPFLTNIAVFLTAGAYMLLSGLYFVMHRLIGYFTSYFAYREASKSQQLGVNFDMKAGSAKTGTSVSSSQTKPDEES